MINQNIYIETVPNSLYVQSELQQTSSNLGCSLVVRSVQKDYLEADIMPYKDKERTKLNRRRYRKENRKECIDCGNIICMEATRCKSCVGKLRVLSEITKKKISEGRLGENNPDWKGDKVKYFGLHNWIRKYKPKPELCEECKDKPPYDVANISGKYKRDINDFRYLCRRCHMKSDGRIKWLE